MPVIRKIEIDHFRCLQRFSWMPSRGINCLVGPGDSGKSTILDAIDYCLGARRNLQLVDTDFYCLQVDKPFSITITIGALDDKLKGLDAYGLYLRGFNRETGEIVEEPEANHETVLTMRLEASADLEPQWTLVSARAAAQDQARNLSWADRQRLAPTRLGAFSEHNLSWRRGSILNRLSEERPDASVALVAAARDVRLAFGDKADMQLAETLKLVSEAAQSLGIPVGTMRALLDSHSVSISGGTISLHNENGVPLKEMGLGSARLLVAGLQRKASANSPVALVDELEYGLEPHRIIRLIDALGAKDKDPEFQVFITTHSPVAVRELSGNQLFVVRKTGGETNVRRVGVADDIQGTIRSFPDALLAPSVLVCEGATETGFVRGLDQYLTQKGKTAVAAHGLAIVDGGGRNTYRRALAFQKLGYRTAVLRDSDADLSADEMEGFATSGGVTFGWRAGFAIEDELFHTLPAEGVAALFEKAVEIKEESLINDHLKSASRNACNVQAVRAEIARKTIATETRAALAKAAKSGKGWFKNVTAMETAAREAIGPHIKASDVAFHDKVTALFKWIKNVAED